MVEPEIVIVIEGCAVTAAATKGYGITYREIDVDLTGHSSRAQMSI